MIKPLPDELDPDADFYAKVMEPEFVEKYNEIAGFLDMFEYTMDVAKQASPQTTAEFLTQASVIQTAIINIRAGDKEMDLLFSEIECSGAEQVKPATMDLKHEHRAPTDDSIKIYKEMEGKAKNAVMSVFASEGNSANFVIAYFDNILDWKKEARWTMTINKKELTGSVMLEMIEHDPQAIAVAIRDDIAKSIANTLLAPAMQEMNRKKLHWGV